MKKQFYLFLISGLRACTARLSSQSFNLIPGGIIYKSVDYNIFHLFVARLLFAKVPISGHTEAMQCRENTRYSYFSSNNRNSVIKGVYLHTI